MKAQIVEPVVQNKNELTKLVVAIHGIGNQFRYATVQSVAVRFSDYCGSASRPPLGSFYPKAPLTTGVLPFNAPKGRQTLQGLGFAEVYWAHIPRGAADKQDTIEEAKAWAKTVVARVRAMDCPDNDSPSVNYKKASSVVAEMVETIGVLESLFFLADKAGIVKFDLADLLTDYLGDVQIVTEFATYREQILHEVHSVLGKLLAEYPSVQEIYLVAHSEGTVVSFLALLEALSGNFGEAPQWDATKVKGFMTLGSPIDKHIVMWPGLWKNLKAPEKRPAASIRWRNYYDIGDPVGFELDTAREWLRENDWTRDPGKTNSVNYFEFTEGDEFGFTRYPLPGKAHNDYWEDTDVFAHFIKDVIEREENSPKPRPPKPRTRPISWLVSWLAPYLICLTLLYGGVYIIFKAGHTALDGGSTGWDIFNNAGAVTLLLAGMTVMARIPRLTKFFPWGFGGAIIFAASLWVFHRWIDPRVAGNLGLFFDQHFGWDGEVAFPVEVAFIGCLSAQLSTRFPGVGLKPLIVLSGLALILTTYALVRGPRPDQALWPVVLAGAGFLYLWWLAALLFDLVFVWHRYIRRGVAMTALKDIGKKHRSRAKSLAAL